MISKLTRNAVISAGLCVLASVAAHAGDGKFSEGYGSHGSFAREMGATLPPKGWVDFCARNTRDCTAEPGKRIRVKLSPDRWREVLDVNDYVNTAIEPATDKEIYKVDELWTYPDRRGDCEDYVLLKRQHLMNLGWPREALLITVVLDREKEGHAVLTVVTDRGEFILDNQDRRVLHWSKAPYQFIKRQAQTHPALWVALDPYEARRARRTSSENRGIGDR